MRGKVSDMGGKGTDGSVGVLFDGLLEFNYDGDESKMFTCNEKLY